MIANQNPQSVDAERSSVEKGSIEVESSLKLDHHGLPLVPQPSDDPNDPLNWSYTKKYFILIILTALSLFSIFSFALINPACACFIVSRCFNPISLRRSSWPCVRPQRRGSLVYRNGRHCGSRRRLLHLGTLRQRVWAPTRSAYLTNSSTHRSVALRGDSDQG
jgi:hypothetical protein